MDRYTRLVLILIAVALTWICIRDLPWISNATASTGAVDVRVIGIRFDPYQPVPVKVQGEVTCRNN